MGSVYITEFDAPPHVATGAPIQIAGYPLRHQSVITTSGSSQQSAAFGSGTKIICVHNTSIISMEFGSNPTATTSKMRRPADNVEYFWVSEGDKIAVIDNT